MEETLVPLMSDSTIQKTCCSTKISEAANRLPQDSKDGISPLPTLSEFKIPKSCSDGDAKKTLYRSKSCNYESNACVKDTSKLIYSNGATQEPLSTTANMFDHKASYLQRSELYSKPKVGVVGTGNFAVAFTKSLVIAGYDVIMGSRRPHLRKSTLRMSDDCLCGVELSSISECFSNSDVIFVAIHMEDFKETLSRHAEVAAGKVVVDVSNREYRYATRSNAEHLASILPQADVVKAFNSVPAQAFEQLAMGGRDNLKVFVASDSPPARAAVAEIAKSFGFLVIDLGRLQSARHMEEMVLKTFTHWRVPIAVTFGIFNLWLLFCVYLYYIERTAFAWEQIFLKVVNKPLCMTAITVLALTYLPGQLASVLQVYHGTKHRRFPRLLDSWLKSRKQLGLISYVLVVVHVVASVIMMSPTYYSSWYHPATVTLPANMTAGTVLPVARTWMTWKGEAACMAGIVAFLLMSMVAVTSIPSVGESLNWSEWRCVHSTLSYVMLFIALLHVTIMGAPGWAKAGPLKIWKSITFLSFLLPATVLLLKILFSLPPLSGYLRKIRRGWERSESERQSASAASSVNSSFKHETALNIENESEGSRFAKSCRCATDDDNCKKCNSNKTVRFVNSGCNCYTSQTSAF